MAKKSKSKEKAISNLNKARGMIGKMIKMTESGDYCISIMQQNLETVSILKSTRQLIAKANLEECLKEVAFEEFLSASRMLNR